MAVYRISQVRRPIENLSRSFVVTPRGALAFVRRHGIVPQSTRGPVPNLADAMAGGPIRGNWWGHRKRPEALFLSRIGPHEGNRQRRRTF